MSPITISSFPTLCVFSSSITIDSLPYLWLCTVFFVFRNFKYVSRSVFPTEFILIILLFIILFS